MRAVEEVRDLVLTEVGPEVGVEVGTAMLIRKVLKNIKSRRVRAKKRNIKKRKGNRKMRRRSTSLKRADRGVCAALR